MIVRKALRWILLLLSIFVICFAVLLTTLRFLTPLINHYRENIEVWAGEVLHCPVHIGKVVASWQGLSPVIQLKEVTLLDPQGQQTVLSIQELDISIALYSSLRERRINPCYLSITGAQLSIHETPVGGWKVVGLNAAQTQQTSFDSQGIWQWLSAQNQISLKNISIKLQGKKGLVIPLTHLTIMLKNAGETHHLVGEGKIEQKQPAHFYFIIDLKGKPGELKKNTIHSYFWVDHLNLQSWLEKFPIKNHRVGSGLVSGQVWLNRQQGQWQNFTSTYTLQNIKITNLTKTDEMSFNNLYGELFGFAAGFNSHTKPSLLLLLKSENFNVYDSHLFTHPIRLGHMQALLQTEACGKTACITLKQLSLHNTALDVQMSAVLSWPQSTMPSQINLSGSYQVHDVTQVPYYLPEKIMSKGLFEWLQAAPLTGQGVNGHLILQGPIADFPFAKGEGQFLNQIDFENLGFNYYHGWPTGHDIKGRLIFKNDSLSAHIASGTIINAPITEADINIPLLSKTQPVVLTIDGQGTPDLNDILLYIQNSPLRLDQGLLQKEIQAQGPATLKLHLVLPLDNASHIALQVQGLVDVTKGKLTEIKNNISLENLQGQVEFSLATITAAKMTGLFLGYPLQFAVQTQTNAQKIPQVFIRGSGELNPANLLEKSFPQIASLIPGVTPYNFTISTPLAKHSSLLPTVAFSSDLKGLAFNLPAPLSKTAQAAATSSLNIDFNKIYTPSLRFNYANDLSAALQWGQQNQLTSGQVHFGPGIAAYQNSPGLLIDGTLETLDIDAWWDVIKKLQQPVALPQAASNTTAPAPLPKLDPKLIRLLDLRINDLLMFKQNIGHIETQAHHSDHLWDINLVGTQVDGEIKINDDYPASPLILNFKRLNLPAATTDKTPSQLTPLGWPPLYFNCQQCQYGKTQLGQMSINLIPITNGLNIKKLKILAPNAYVDASGSWVLQNGVQQTQIQGKVHSNNFGNLLKDLKLTSNIEGKKGDADFDLNWPSPPSDPTLTQVNGKVGLQLGQGRIVDVGSHQGDIDIGKLLNIFSFQSLLQHLQFSFTDLTDNGYTFSVMAGHYTLQQGLLNTTDTYFDGPVAKLTIKGSMDLKQQHYDVVLGVTPYITSSLPMLVTVAGTAVAGPFGLVAGAATWAVSKMMSPEIEKMTTYQYQVMGPFKDPKITEIKTGVSRQIPYQ